jgi:hypothetical protein
MVDPNAFRSLATSGRRMPGDPLVSPPVARPRWLKVLAAIAIANFAAFVLVAGYLGGDALNGYVRDGHYFLAAKGHAYEVSRALYLYSKWHALSAISLSGAVVVAWAILWRRAQLARRTGPYPS